MGTKNRGWKGLWLLLLMALVATACGGETSTAAASGEGEAEEAPAEDGESETTPVADDGDGEVITLGLITKFPHPFFFAIEDAAQEWSDANGVELVTGAGESGTDDEGVIEIIESMVAQGVDGIAITPTGPAVQPALDAAIAEGIPIVLVDNDLPDWDGKSSVVATDNFQGGVLAGEWLVANLESGSTLGVLEGVAGTPSLDDRVNGLLQALDGSGIEVVSSTATDCDQVMGVSATEDLLTANPDVNAIYAACGPPIMGALQALSNAGIAPEDIVTVGFDAGDDEIVEIAAGNQDASVAQFPPKMGELGIATLHAVVTGGDFEANVDTGTGIVTAENVDEFGG